MLEDFRFEQINACVDGVAQRLINGGFLLEGLNATFGVADDNSVAADLILGNPFGDQAGKCSLLTMTPHGFGEVKINQGISAQHHEGVVEEVLEILDLLQSTG